MPSTATDRIDGLTTSVAVKAPVRIVTLTNITLSGEQTLQGVALVEGDRVLAAGQTTASTRGIYVVQTNSWTRAPDFDGARDVVNGTFIPIAEGDNADALFRLTTANPIVIGTTSLTFENTGISPTSFIGHSTSSVAIGLGAKTFTIETGKSFVAGQYVLITFDSDFADYFVGPITSYNPTTGELVVNAVAVGGSGTNALWTITVSGVPIPGPQGDPGDTGPTGPPGEDGEDGADGSRIENLVINGDWQIAQRPAIANGATGYTGAADRWYRQCTPDGGTGTASIQENRVLFTLGQTDVPDNPLYYLNSNQPYFTGSPGAGAFAAWQQSIEDVRRTAGKNVTVSFWAKAGSGTGTIKVGLKQDFDAGGGGDSPVYVAGQSCALTTTWTKFSLTFAVPSLAGKTVGLSGGTSGSHYLALSIFTHAGATVSTTNNLGGAFSVGTSVQITDVALVIGSSSPTVYPRDTLIEALRKCQRYFWKSFSYPLVPAQNTGQTVGAISSVALGGTAGSTFYGTDVRLPVVMRTYPTVIFYNSSAANAKWRNVTVAADSGVATADNLTDNGFGAYSPHVSGDNLGSKCHVHATADAEF